jgi:hypothetical protein
VSEFDGFYARHTEPALWTVGFDNPATGRWEPVSDHTSRAEAIRYANDLNGGQYAYAFFRSEPGLWAVGECTGGQWTPASDHDTEAEAVAETIRLNA